MSSVEFLQNTNPSRASCNSGHLKQEPWGGSELEDLNTKLKFCFKLPQSLALARAAASILPGQNPAGWVAEVATVLGRRPVRTLILFARGFFIASWRKHKPFAPSFAVPGKALVAALGMPKRL